MFGRKTSQRSSNQRGQKTPSLLTTSRGPRDLSIELEGASSADSLDTDYTLKKKSEEHADDGISYSSSNVSSGSEYSRGYESNPSMYVDSEDEGDGLEGYLQMGCMDSFFLPGGEKAKPKRSLVKVNKYGEKELNLNVKGALALGYEARMKEDDDATFSSALHDTISCRAPSVMGGGRRYDENLVIEDTREVESKQFRSLMSLSHESSCDEGGRDKDDEDVVSIFELPPEPPRFQMEPPPGPVFSNRQHQEPMYQDYHQQQYPNQGQNYYQSQPPHNRQYHDNHHPIVGGMPFQIVVQDRQTFEDESCLTYDNAIAPDPPTNAALPQILEEEYSCSSSEGASPTVPGTIDDQKSSSSKEARLSKAERWRKANVQRLKQNKGSSAARTDDHPTPEITKDERGEKVGDHKDDTSVGSDQATHSSLPGLLEQTTSEEVQTHVSEGGALAFDSILSQRIQKRRVAKLKNSWSSESSVDQIAHSNTVEGSSEKQLRPEQKSQNAVDEEVSPLPFSQKSGGTSEIFSRDKMQYRRENTGDLDSAYDSASVIEAVAAAAAAVLSKQNPSMGCHSYDQEDTENQAPSHLSITGHKAKSLFHEGSSRRTPTYQKVKNPFQDDDLFDEEEDDQYAYPLLTSSSSDDMDILEPPSLARPKVVASSPRVSMRGVPMSPSYRQPSGASVVSPRLYGRRNPSPMSRSTATNEWHSTVDKLSKRVVSTSINKSPRAQTKSPRGGKTNVLSPRGSVLSAHSALSNGTESEFFEAEMYHD